MKIITNVNSQIINCRKFGHLKMKMLDKISNQKNITNDLEKCYSKYSSKNKPKIGVKKNEIRTKYRSKKQDEKINQK